MKRYLAVIVAIITLLVTLKTNVPVWAEESEENVNNGLTDIPCETDLLVDDGIENCMIIGTGDYDQEATLFLDNYATYYFSNLIYNFGNNYIGSCSYTAAAMLLSFYDTYWNDEIIPGHYEYNKRNFNKSLPLSNQVDSPGIVREVVPKNVDYPSFVESYKNQYFHLKLISIGLETGIDLFGDYILFPDSVRDLLEYYFYDILGYNSSEVTVDHITGFEDVREYAINKVKQGIPVFVSGAGVDGSAHSYIIYDYDETNDELYCHMGWMDKINSDGVYLTTHVSFSSIDYTLFEGAVTIEFNGDHVHSNNYVASDGTTYCSCYFSCHPEHMCTYEPYDDEQHIYTCNCVNKTDNKLDHEYEYVIVSDFYHILKCDCGATSGIQEGHIYTGSGLIGYVKCIQCGFLKYVGNTTIPIIKGKIPTIEAICKE